MTRKTRKTTARYLENAALGHLGRFATSAENLRRVLTRRVERSARFHGTDRAEGAVMVGELIARFTGAGLLDDDAYAHAQAQSLHRRGASARMIGHRLRRKGVAAEVVEAAIEALSDDAFDLELEAAVNLARRRRLGPYRTAGTRVQWREKDLAALSRAGFSFAIARRIVEAETADELAAEASGE